MTKINTMLPTKPQKGFTLIELLVVMAIIAILTTIGVGNFRTARVKARDAARKSDLQTIAKSLEAYVNDYRSFPTSSNGKILCQPPSTICDWGSSFEDANGTIYSAKLPKELATNYVYLYESTDGSSFTIYAVLENANDPTIDNSITAECSPNITCNYKITSTNIQ